MSPQFDAIGMVVADMADSVAFYRLLSLTFPEGAEGTGHAEGELPGGIRVMLDTEDMVRSFDRTFELLPGRAASGWRSCVRVPTRSIASTTPSAKPGTAPNGHPSTRSGASDMPRCSTPTGMPWISSRRCQMETSSWVDVSSGSCSWVMRVLPWVRCGRRMIQIEAAIRPATLPTTTNT